MRSPALILIILLFGCKPYERLNQPTYGLKEPDLEQLQLPSNPYESWLFYKSESAIAWETPLNADKLLNDEIGVDDLFVGVSPSTEDTLMFYRRKIEMPGVLNFRDLGGIRTKDGRQVRWRKLYRSGHLHDLKSKGHEPFTGLGIQSIVDLRTIGENEEKPDELPANAQTSIYHIPISGITDEDLHRTEKEIRKQSPDEFDGTGKMKQVMKQFAMDGKEDFAEVFQLLLNEKNYPLVYHCTAGKDRTGLLTALILAALGVEEEVIMQDYLLSNYFRYEKIERNARLGAHILAIDTASSRPIMDVRQAYLESSWDAIRQEYGSVNNYLREALSLSQDDLDMLRQHLLY